MIGVSVTKSTGSSLVSLSMHPNVWDGKTSKSSWGVNLTCSGYVMATSDEARQLAAALIVVADAADREQRTEVRP